jgi:flavin reductase (DIM6/NTAB) family NADH-FMN oxidoreductase RutF
MAASDSDYRAAMRRFASAVTLIATEHESERSALTATAVCSLAISPPRLLICVNLCGRTFSLLEKSRRLSVNVLASEHEPLARRFAGMIGNRRDDHFVHGAWCTRVTGAPVLSDALAAFDCYLAQMTVLDTHAVLIAEVEDLIVREQHGAPLLYVQGAFFTIPPLAASTA